MDALVGRGHSVRPQGVGHSVPKGPGRDACHAFSFSLSFLSSFPCFSSSPAVSKVTFTSDSYKLHLLYLFPLFRARESMATSLDKPSTHPSCRGTTTFIRKGDILNLWARREREGEGGGREGEREERREKEIYPTSSHWGREWMLYNACSLCHGAPWEGVT